MSLKDVEVPTDVEDPPNVEDLPNLEAPPNVEDLPNLEAPRYAEASRDVAIKIGLFSPSIANAKKLYRHLPVRAETFTIFRIEIHPHSHTHERETETESDRPN